MDNIIHKLFDDSSNSQMQQNIAGRDKILKILQNVARLVRYSLNKRDATLFSSLSSIISKISLVLAGYRKRGNIS